MLKVPLVSKIFAAFLAMICVPIASAQITFDGSVGTLPSSGFGGPDYKILQSYGRTQGSNLFHSFAEFNINPAESASFTVGPSITNVISRVTGGNGSIIDGPLNIDGGPDGANFWMINPAGIMVGPNATFDIGGSLNIGAADYLSFTDDIEFTAIDESISLTVSSPTEFGFLEAGGGVGELYFGPLDDPLSIELSASSAAEDNNRYKGLWLAGRDVSLKGLVIASGPGKNIQGDIKITGGQISLIDSKIYTLTETAVDGPDIIIMGDDVSLLDGTHLLASTEVTGTESTGAGGDISIEEANTVTVSGLTTISVDTEGGSKGGEITIDANELISIDDSTLSASASADGHAGSIMLQAGEVSPFLGIRPGNDSQIRISNGARIKLESNASGQGGTLVIKTGELLLNTSPNRRPLEDAKRVEISGESSSKDGIPAHFEISANSIVIANSEIRITSVSDRVGFHPSVTLRAIRGNLQLFDSNVESTTSGTSDAGFIKINAGDSGNTGTILTLDHSTIQAASLGAGNGKGIEIQAGSLSLLNGSLISSEASSTGAAGNITIAVEDKLSILGNSAAESKITTDAQISKGGNIAVTVGGELKMQNGIIGATVGAGTDNGGKITVNAGNVFMQYAGILSRAADGEGGGIDLVIAGSGQAFVIDSQSIINADADSGNAGEINVNTPDVDLDSGLQELDVSIVATAEIAEDECSPATTGMLSTFRQEDEGGTPVAPDRYLLASVSEELTATASGGDFQDLAIARKMLAAIKMNPRETCR
ncbi:MAG: hypothetical protein COB20_16000 [SAR86 cluster bacterium]|uniref:Filamentous haemagglutinin FhaB/tRNA nuclease CdiA-like TPS domain-containing protein n=1 Tax=SAR86 cluster bacterium TaxID=2030880 RepID=A0A2A4WUY5_9GAMM|nr:MAG: hypothetical protein COB20_16000 [SAR86 cluster bacterium]